MHNTARGEQRTSSSCCCISSSSFATSMSSVGSMLICPPGNTRSTQLRATPGKRTEELIAPQGNLRMLLEQPQQLHRVRGFSGVHAFNPLSSTLSASLSPSASTPLAAPVDTRAQAPATGTHERHLNLQAESNQPSFSYRAYRLGVPFPSTEPRVSDGRRKREEGSVVAKRVRRRRAPSRPIVDTPIDTQNRDLDQQRTNASVRYITQ